MIRPVSWPSLAAVAALLASGCADGDRGAQRAAPEGAEPAATSSVASTSAVPSTSSAPSAPSAPSGVGAPVVAAAGDIACEPGQSPAAGRCQMEATARLVEAAAPAVVLTLGDNQYDDGALDKFRRSYDRSWGRFKAITRPSPGNHDVAGDGGGSGYFSYFGASAGAPGDGWYSFDVGGWHMVALNSNCEAAGGCGPSSPQIRWLRADLAASESACTLAYWHHPRFSSGLHGGSDATAELWRVLHDSGAELVLNGHDHHYERFAPLTPAGSVDTERGIRQFVVGTGGRSLYRLRKAQTGSEVRQSSSFGVLLLTLGSADYQWRFVPAPGSDFADSGRGVCH